MPLTPTERSLRASLAAHVLHARGGTNTEPARKAFDQRFLDEVDPDRILDPADRHRRAAHARKAYFQRLALKSSRARRDRAEAKALAEAARGRAAS